MSEAKYIDIRPRYEKVPFKNLAGVVFQYGIADCSNLEDGAFAKVLRYMRRCYNGRAITDGQLPGAPGRPDWAVPPVRSDVRESGPPPAAPSAVVERDAAPAAGDQGVATSGDGSGRAETAVIAEAVALLEPENDEHWAADGRPSLAAVAELSGIQDLTRDKIEIAAPDVTRPAQD